MSPIHFETHVVVGTGVPRIAEAVSAARAGPVLFKPIRGRALIVEMGTKILHKRLDDILLERSNTNIDNTCEDLVDVVVSFPGGKVSNMGIVRRGDACAN